VLKVEIFSQITEMGETIQIIKQEYDSQVQKVSKSLSETLITTRKLTESTDSLSSSIIEHQETL
jgi:hypothetical protein